MAQISKIYVKEKAECVTMTIRKTIDFMKEYADFVGYAVETIEQYAQAKDILFSGPLMVCFHNMKLESLDVEVGWEISSEITGEDDIEINRLPGTKIVTTIDQGAYEEQDPTLHSLFSFINESKMTMKGSIYYYYLNGTEQKPQTYLTEMVIPVE